MREEQKRLRHLAAICAATAPSRLHRNQEPPCDSHLTNGLVFAIAVALCRSWARSAYASPFISDYREESETTHSFFPFFLLTLTAVLRPAITYFTWLRSHENWKCCNLLTNTTATTKPRNWKGQHLLTNTTATAKPQNWKSRNLLTNTTTIHYRDSESIGIPYPTYTHLSHNAQSNKKNPATSRPRNTPLTGYTTLRRRQCPQPMYPQSLPPRNKSPKMQHKRRALHDECCTTHIAPLDACPRVSPAVATSTQAGGSQKGVPFRKKALLFATEYRDNGKIAARQASRRLARLPR